MLRQVELVYMIVQLPFDSTYPPSQSRGQRRTKRIACSEAGLFQGRRAPRLHIPNMARQLGADIRRNIFRTSLLCFPCCNGMSNARHCPQIDNTRNFVLVSCPCTTQPHESTSRYKVRPQFEGKYPAPVFAVHAQGSYRHITLACIMAPSWLLGLDTAT